MSAFWKGTAQGQDEAELFDPRGCAKLPTDARMSVRRNPPLDLLAALLPVAEREALVRRGAEPLDWSVLLGLVEFFLGGAMLVADALAFFPPRADAAASRLLEIAEMTPQEIQAHPEIGHVGAVIWLDWTLRPFTWLLASVALVGVVRLVAFGVSREVVGEPLVWLAVRAAQAVGRLLHGSRDLLRFGPERPDRVIREPGSDLVVLSCRPKPDWNERITIEIGERFYFLRRVEERQDGTWWAYAHVLHEMELNEIIRSLIRYIPPAP